MNHRLTAIFQLIRSDVGVIDVGTDHGYIPTALAQSGYAGNIYASDIHEEPLNAARRTAAEAGVQDRIAFSLCDGLAECPPDAVDCIIIAGMGGDMIVKILDEAEWSMDPRYQLVLQPMTKAEVVRYWLANNEYAIEQETLVDDAGTLYQIIVARFDGVCRLSDAELFVGKKALHNDKALYARLLEEMIRRFEKMVIGMAEGESVGNSRYVLAVDIWNQLRELKEKA